MAGSAHAASGADVGEARARDFNRLSEFIGRITNLSDVTVRSIARANPDDFEFPQTRRKLSSAILKDESGYVVYGG